MEVFSEYSQDESDYQGTMFTDENNNYMSRAMKGIGETTGIFMEIKC